MGEWRSPDTPATKVKFFKVDAPTYDASTGTFRMFFHRSSNLISTDKWANEQAAAQGSRHSFQIPSDIKSGTYVVRTELLALHGNSLGGSVTGPEFYVGCFNVDVIGSGTASPEGATFPGAYKDGDIGLTFKPYFGRGANPTHNVKYVSPLPIF
jgi:cellulase